MRRAPADARCRRSPPAATRSARSAAQTTRRSRKHVQLTGLGPGTDSTMCGGAPRLARAALNDHEPALADRGGGLRVGQRGTGIGALELGLRMERFHRGRASEEIPSSANGLIHAGETSGMTKGVRTCSISSSEADSEPDMVAALRKGSSLRRKRPARSWGQRPASLETFPRILLVGSPPSVTGQLASF